MGFVQSSPVDASRWRQRIATITTSSKEEIRLNYIHGFPQTSYQFRNVVTPLSDAGYRVIAPDYRGAGQSSNRSGGDRRGQRYEYGFSSITSGWSSASMYCNDDDKEMRYLSQWVALPMPKHSTCIHPLCENRECTQGNRVCRVRLTLLDISSQKVINDTSDTNITTQNNCNRNTNLLAVFGILKIRDNLKIQASHSTGFCETSKCLQALQWNH
jgi:hypothetical protein